MKPLPPESAGTAPGRGRLKGRNILIVGGGQRVLDAATDPVGNGRAMSLLFAREGAAVAVADMNRASAEETAALIGKEGGKAHAIEADISRPADIERMIAEAEAALGAIDGLVLNAGIGVLNALVKVGLATSNGEARRHISSGAVRVNDAVIDDDKLVLADNALLAEGVIKLSIGKKRHALLKPV